VRFSDGEMRRRRVALEAVMTEVDHVVVYGRTGRARRSAG
jgi:hypothetical protein